MNNEDTTSLIYALLFTLGKPVSRKELSQKLNVSLEVVEEGLRDRTQSHGGIILVDDGVMVELRTAPYTTAVIEKVRKEEYAKEIGRAGLETVAAILYRGPLSRSEIDFIRGVNSSYIVRSLLVRGLVRKVANPENTRSVRFEPTTELLAHLGIVHVSELPHYTDVREKLSVLEKAYRQTEQSENDV